jgi:hypothetical protein
VDVDAAVRDSTHEIAAEVWENVLGTPVDRESEFFELGGHSILATRLIAQLSARLETEVPLRLLFELPGFDRFCDGLDALLDGR